MRQTAPEHESKPDLGIKYRGWDNPFAKHRHFTQKPSERLALCYRNKIGFQRGCHMLGTTPQCFLICLLLLSQPSQLPAHGVHEGGVRGQVVDRNEHAPIRNAYVLAHRNGNTDSHVRTDDSGKYVMALSEGIYDVFVSADGFSPTSRKVWVTPDGVMTLDAALEFNGLGLEQNRNP
jgi:hypothetical protein